MQERHNSIAYALDLCLYCTNPSIWGELLYAVLTRNPSITGWYNKFVDEYRVWSTTKSKFLHQTDTDAFCYNNVPCGTAIMKIEH